VEPTVGGGPKTRKEEIGGVRSEDEEIGGVRLEILTFELIRAEAGGDMQREQAARNCGNERSSDSVGEKKRDSEQEATRAAGHRPVGGNEADGSSQITRGRERWTEEVAGGFGDQRCAKWRNI
jgi:hypothetical protein